MIQFDNSYAQLPSDFYSLIDAPNEWKPTLIAFNHALADELGIDLKEVSEEQLAAFFAATEFMPGSRPVAMAYAGQQFGHFVPQLGDGRAMLLGEFVAKNNERYDIHLKGSGRTSFSRRGDGRSALGPVIREYILSEGMHALGVPSTRTLCAVRTGEVVQRDTPAPGAVMTRLARSHVRVGTFQYFAGRNDPVNLKLLTDYTVARLYPQLVGSADLYFQFWSQVAERQMKLIAHWMSLGFIHGVMNTDNVNVSGETIDYGPCAFMDEFNWNKVFSSIDQNGRYAYSNQPKVGLWNLARLAECLMLLMDGTQEENGQRFSLQLQALQGVYEQEFHTRMLTKLGLIDSHSGDNELVKNFLQLLQDHELDFTLSFLDLERMLNEQIPFTQLATVAGFVEWEKSWLKRSPSKALMTKTNPSVIPRNHQVEQAIQAANNGDDGVFHEMVEAVRYPFIRTEELMTFQKAPALQERVLRTFCGT